MISELARGDYEDLLARGLHATLDDFDRLNQIALRLTDGAETTAANFPRVGWAGDIPFHQPTCAAIAWYVGRVERSPFDTGTKNLCWYFALAHGRTRGAFDGLDAPNDIKARVDGWVEGVHATMNEMSRACRYAVEGFEDARAGKTEAERKREGRRTEDERCERTLANVEERITEASAATGIAPDALATETPSRLVRMVESVRRLHKIEFSADENRLRADYDLTLREIVKRLNEEKEAAGNG